MKNPTSQNDIDEVRRNGYDPDTLLRAESKLAAYLAVAEPIKAAFAGVKLGKGVSLKQTRGLVDYADAETLAALRVNDEKDDWTKIPVQALNEYHGLSFFDAEGMLFHLPAYMLAELSGEYSMSVMFHLTHLSEHGKSQFSLFNPAQRQAVRGFLLYALNDPEYEIDHTKIQAALRDFWTEQPV